MRKKLLSSGEEQISIFYYWWISFRIWSRKNFVERFQNYKARRAHRSFRLTRRRDYIRPLEIIGFWRFSKRVFGFIFQNKKLFFKLIGLIAFANFILIGLLDQDFITSLQSVVDLTNGGIFEGGWGEIGKAGLVVISTFSTGGLVQNPSEMQQLIMFLIVLFAWLAVVQICRNILAGRRNLSLRDALYSCGAPIIPLMVIAVVILIQAIPIFIGVLVSSAAKLTEFASVGVEKLAFSSVVFLLLSLSIYWITGSIFAAIIVTNQGGGHIIYPFQALKISGDMVTQRRLAILYRVVFCAFILAIIWGAILVPLVLLMNWLGSNIEFFTFIPIVQIVMVLLTAFSLVYSSSYIYLLYRKIIDYDRKN
jgi:hypothetical protein